MASTTKHILWCDELTFHRLPLHRIVGGLCFWSKMVERKRYRLYERLDEGKAFNFWDGKPKAYSVAEFINKIKEKSPTLLKRHFKRGRPRKWAPIKGEQRVCAKLENLEARVSRGEVRNEHVHKELKRSLFCYKWWWDELKESVSKRWKWRFWVRVTILCLLLISTIVSCICDCYLLFWICLATLLFLGIFLFLAWYTAAYIIFDTRITLPKSTYDTVRFAVSLMAGFAGAACGFLAARSPVEPGVNWGIFLFVLSLAFGLWTVLFLTAVSEELEETLQEGKRPIIFLHSKYWDIMETFLLFQVMLFISACIALLVGTWYIGWVNGS